MCSCTGSANTNCGAIEICGTTVIEDLFSDAVVPSASTASIVQEVLENTAYSFTGAHTDDNWIQVSDQTKTSFFNHVDNQAFTLSFWIMLDPTSRSSYILSFENNGDRYFSLFDNSKGRAVIYYYRDTLGSLEQGDDGGYETQVALSFYYDSNILPDGLRDNEWHFIALSVNIPTISLTVDGYVLRPTQGNYYDSTNMQILLDRDGTIYDMPAPILVKNQAVIDSLTGYIGGSARGSSFALDGAMRQLILTNPFTTDAYSCLGSCGVNIFPDDSVGGFTTFYDPAKRVFEFSSSADPAVPIGDAEYTEFMGTLVFSDNGFLLPEEQGESWRISVQVSDKQLIFIHVVD